VLPLRSEAIRKARQVNKHKLLKLLSAYSFGALFSASASVILWRFRPWMSTIVFFELWALPLDALTFCTLAFSESLHIAEEMSLGGKVSEPLVTAEKRTALLESASLLQGTIKGLVIFCHRIALLWSFGVKWRLADFLLLSDIRLSARRALLKLQHHLQDSTVQFQAHHNYPCASPGSLYALLFLTCSLHRINVL
jgi:hypothetical protein